MLAHEHITMVFGAPCNLPFLDHAKDELPLPQKRRHSNQWVPQ